MSRPATTCSFQTEILSNRSSTCKQIASHNKELLPRGFGRVTVSTVLSNKVKGADFMLTAYLKYVTKLQNGHV